jgi:hypothetical protein
MFLLGVQGSCYCYQVITTISLDQPLPVPLIFVSFENSSRPSSAASLYLSFLSHSFRVTTGSLKASLELLLLCLSQPNDQTL